MFEENTVSEVYNVKHSALKALFFPLRKTHIQWFPVWGN